MPPFIQKVRCVCQISISKNFSKPLSWAWNLNKMFTVFGGKFKFQGQDSNLDYFWGDKVRIFWEGHKIWKNLPLKMEDFYKFCGLLRISELYLTNPLHFLKKTTFNMVDQWSTLKLYKCRHSLKAYCCCIRLLNVMQAIVVG